MKSRGRWGDLVMPWCTIWCFLKQKERRSGLSMFLLTQTTSQKWPEKTWRCAQAEHHVLVLLFSKLLREAEEQACCPFTAECLRSWAKGFTCKVSALEPAAVWYLCNFYIQALAPKTAHKRHTQGKPKVTMTQKQSHSYKAEHVSLNLHFHVILCICTNSRLC